jgi:hypothetical protein
MECPICLDIIKDSDLFTLSCNHKLHYNCFLSYIMNKDGNIFVDCPLCRQMNWSNVRPYEDDRENIKKFGIMGKCSALTKKGTRCKNKCSLMNYGMCSKHHSNILLPDKYKFMSDLIFYIIESANTIKTKIIMLDVSKKLLINHPEIDTIPKIQHFFYRYYHHNDNKKISAVDGIYKYYGLEIIPEGWIGECITNNKLF